MTAAGTNVTYVVVPNGTHTTGIRERVDQYIAFIEEHLPPYPPTPEEEESSEEYVGPFFVDEVPFTLATLVQQMVLL